MVFGQPMKAWPLLPTLPRTEGMVQSVDGGKGRDSLLGGENGDRDRNWLLDLLAFPWKWM